MVPAVPTPPSAPVEVRPLRRGDLPDAARRQLRELPEGFFSELGPRFVERYLETYLDGPVAVALVAEHDGRQVGHLVGTVGPQHYRWALQTRWRRLLPVALLALARNPALVARFLRTRTGRYGKAVLRVLRPATSGAPTGPPRASGAARGPAALLHVAVDAQARGAGAGAALVTAFEQRARAAGCVTARLVTFAGDPDSDDGSGAGGFYERLGWQRSDERVDDAGRLVLVYARTL